MAKLIIENRKDFDDAVWQTESGFSQGQYNEWLKNSVDVLQRIKAEIEDSDEVNVRTSELYMMGDVINLLSCITIVIDESNV